MRRTTVAKTAQNYWRDVGWPQVALHSQLSHFPVVCCIAIVCVRDSGPVCATVSS